MITDLVLVGLACVPETRPDVADGAQAIRFEVKAGGAIGTPSDEGLSLAGAIRDGAFQPAFWGKFWRAIKRIGACAGCGLTGYDPMCRYCREGEKRILPNPY
jgi:hypothetical protein